MKIHSGAHHTRCDMSSTDCLSLRSVVISYSVLTLHVYTDIHMCIYTYVCMCAHICMFPCMFLFCYNVCVPAFFAVRPCHHTFAVAKGRSGCAVRGLGHNSSKEHTNTLHTTQWQANESEENLLTCKQQPYRDTSADMRNTCNAHTHTHTHTHTHSQLLEPF